METQKYLEKVERQTEKNQMLEIEKRSDTLILVVFVISLICIFLYNFVLLSIRAKYEWMYNLGIVFNNLCMAVVGSSIFYYLTILKPRNDKRKMYTPYVLDNLRNVASSIEEIIRIITGTKDWLDKENADVKASSQKFNANRKIWSDYDEEVYNDGHIMHIGQETILRLECELTKLDSCIQKLQEYDIPLYSEIKNLILKYYSTYFHYQVRLAISMAETIKEDSFKLAAYDTEENYCTMVFKDEIPLRLFAFDKKANTILIDLLRNIITQIKELG